jgi:hypothetical protein
MSFNIKNRALFDTTVLHLVDPDTGNDMYADEKETQPLTIELYGRSSKQYRNWLASATRKAEKEKLANKGKEKSKTPDESIEDSAEFLAAVSIKATNFDYEGVAIDSKEMFKKLYADPSLMWVGEQVVEKLGDMSAFLPK